MSDWKPIETAPKDGTPVLIWNAKWKHPMSAWWEINPNLDKKNGWTNGAVKSWAYEETQLYAPTHWMPLPEPPK